MTSKTQPKIPFGLGRGDKVTFDVTDETARQNGTIVDVLSSQFLIEGDNGNTYITHFQHVKPWRESS